MRARLALSLALLFLATQVHAGDIEFDLTAGTIERAKKGVMRIPVTLTLSIDQLQFAEDGAELAAKFSVRSDTAGFTRVLKDSYRIAAPAGTVPTGLATYRFDLIERAPAAVTISVVDLNSGRTGTRSLSVEATRVLVEPLSDGPAADTAWRVVLARAKQEKKPIVVFFRGRGCGRCRDLDRIAVPHPAIQRRLPAVIFTALPADAGEASKAWHSADSGVALFDRAGTLRVRWPVVPGTTTLGIILDSAIAVAPHFERAVQLAESGSPEAGEVEAAIGLTRLARFTDARAALERPLKHADPETRQAAIVAMAVLDANDGQGAEALAALQDVAANAATPKIAADASTAIAAIHRASTPPTVRGAIRILPLTRQVVSGRQTVRTHITSAAVARVVFSLDGREIGRVERPPFSTTLDFGAVPERHAIGVVAFDRRGQDIGRDERIVNEGGETFWIRLLSPREGPAAGAVRVTMNVRTPAARRVRRVVISWNDAERAVLTAAPWESVIRIPSDQVGVLRAVAELDDERTSEDAVLLNAGGAADRASVQLVELPLTIVSADGSLPKITASDITLREGDRVRRVEAVSTAADTPLTVGLLIDSSASMQKTLPDLQETAIRFLETMLGERDRAFLVTFDSHARLIQPATSDVSLLRRQIMSIQPNGATALHDAMALGLLQFEGIPGRRAMILFSDGLDGTSEYRAAEVSELARRSNVPIHVIATDPGVPPDLAGIAESTGATSHTLDTLTQLPAVYARIEAALRAQILAFVRTDPGTRENEWRRIRVEVRGPNLRVHAPDGYYAPF